MSRGVIFLGECERQERNGDAGRSKAAGYQFVRVVTVEAIASVTAKLIAARTVRYVSLDAAYFVEKQAAQALALPFVVRAELTISRRAAWR